jgi:uncharacterized protein
MQTLLYFVKLPEPGYVKTRLGKSIGMEQAATAYRLLAESNALTLRNVLDDETSVVIAYDPPDREYEMRRWLSSHFEYLAQDGAGLTERLQNAFSSAFRSGAKKAVALGSDTLGLCKETVRSAFQALDSSDVVLGPAKDGGYYLIGLKQSIPELFEQIPWSTSRVMGVTLSAAKSRGLACHILQKLEDLDDVTNLK